MMRRCFISSDYAYKDYGGRGITVCTRWHTFKKFLRDMGDPPDNKTLDRVDNNGPYSPENCRWATRQQQAENRRRIRLVTVNNETMSFTRACKTLNIPFLRSYREMIEKYEGDHQRYISTKL